MDCDEIQRRVEEGGDVREAGVVAHLQGCAACTAMVAAAPGLPRPRAASGEGPAWADVLAAIEREERPAARARSWATPRRVAVGFVAAAIVPLVVLIAMPRPDMGVYPALRMLVECLGLLAAIGWAAAIVLQPLQRPADPARTRWATAFAIAVVVVLAALPEAHHDHPASILGDGQWFARARGCFLFGSLCAVPTFVALRLLARDGDRMGARAWIVAACTASVGIAAVYLHCPIVHPSHLWSGHVTVLLVPGLWALATILRRRK